MRGIRESKLVLAVSGLSNTVLILGWFIVLFSGVLILIMLTPTFLWVASDGIDSFTGKELHRISSPDARYQILISRRTHFPAFDLFDPTTTATFSLTDTATSQVLDSESFLINDICDLHEPEVAWKPGYVEVKNIDPRNPAGLILTSTSP